MKRSITTLLFITLLSGAITCLGQAKKPTIMVLPTEVWCNENGYSTTIETQGKTTRVADYERALQENGDLLNAITKIGMLMADRGLPLKDASSEIRNINRTNVANDMMTSRTSGAIVAETPYEKLLNTAKADIVVELGWKVNAMGPKKSVTYTLRGIDAYTNKQVAAAQGTGAQSFSAEVPVLIEEAVLENMDGFIAQLQDHFDDLLENGREIVVNLWIFDNGSDLTFEQEYGADELTDVIDDWMADQTVNHRYNLSDAGETHMSFEQVRIPLYRENGSPMDARHFGTSLRRFLSKPPYSIPAKVQTIGLGRVDIFLGEK